MKLYKVLDVEDVQRSFQETEDILIENHRKSFKLHELMLKLINEAKIEGLELGQRRSYTAGECDTYAEIEWLVMIERGNLAQSCAPVSDSSRLLDSSSTIQRNNEGREYCVSEISESLNNINNELLSARKSHNLFQAA